MRGSEHASELNVNVYLQERNIQMHISHSKDTSWDKGAECMIEHKREGCGVGGRWLLSAFILQIHSLEIKHALIVGLSIVGHKHPINHCTPGNLASPDFEEEREADHEL